MLINNNKYICNTIFKIMGGKTLETIDHDFHQDFCTLIFYYLFFKIEVHLVHQVQGLQSAVDSTQSTVPQCIYCSIPGIYTIYCNRPIVV
jgi:hypothetical protein